MSRIFSRAITLQPPKSDLVTQLKYATSAGEESTLEKAKNVVSDTIGTLKEKASDLVRFFWQGVLDLLLKF